MSLSRSDLARYLAQRIASGELDDSDIERSGAATKTLGFDVDLLVDDVCYYLESLHGKVMASVTSARELSQGLKDKIEQFVADQTGKEVMSIEFTTDDSLIGGAIIKSATTEFDVSAQTMLSKIGE